MAGPAFKAAGSRVQSASAATLSPGKPTAAAAAGLLLAIVTSKNNATHGTATSGWTLIAQVNSGAGFTASLWRAKGNAGAPTFTWTGAAACSAQLLYYDDPANNVDPLVGASTSNTGSTSTHSTSSITTTRANSLVAYIDVSAANTALATPSGWTEDGDGGSSTDAGRTVYGEKAVSSSGSGSGAISVTGAAADWVQFQVELLGELGDGFQVSAASLSAWAEPDDVANFSNIEVAAWLDSVEDAAKFSKIEVGAWLDLEPAAPGGSVTRGGPLFGLMKTGFGF